MDLDHNLVLNCPLCELFLNPEKNIKTKLHYPDIDKINEVNFIVIDSASNKTFVVVRDHTPEISKEVWGRILYQVRKMFGNGVRLVQEQDSIKDHWHIHCVMSRRW